MYKKYIFQVTNFLFHLSNRVLFRVYIASFKHEESLDKALLIRQKCSIAFIK